MIVVIIIIIIIIITIIVTLQYLYFVKQVTFDICFELGAFQVLFALKSCELNSPGWIVREFQIGMHLLQNKYKKFLGVLLAKWFISDNSVVVLYKY